MITPPPLPPQESLTSLIQMERGANKEINIPPYFLHDPPVIHLIMCIMSFVAVASLYVDQSISSAYRHKYRACKQ